jgi:hypothetical protein
VESAAGGGGGFNRFVLDGDDRVPSFWGERRFLRERSGTASSSRERASRAMMTMRRGIAGRGGMLRFVEFSKMLWLSIATPVSRQG